MKCFELKTRPGWGLKSRKYVPLQKHSLTFYCFAPSRGSWRCGSPSQLSIRREAGHTLVRSGENERIPQRAAFSNGFTSKGSGEKKLFSLDHNKTLRWLSVLTKRCKPEQQRLNSISFFIYKVSARSWVHTYMAALCVVEVPAPTHDFFIGTSPFHRSACLLVTVSHVYLSALMRKPSRVVALLIC